MAEIAIGDLTGSAQIDVSDTSLAGENRLRKLKTEVSDFVAALSRPVTDALFQDAHFGAEFENSTIPLENNTVDVKASVNSTLAVARQADSPLFSEDDYDPIAISGDECWVSFELDTLLDASVAAPLPSGFGVSFEASAAPSFATYRRIPTVPAPAITLKEAIGQTLDVFDIPDSAKDVLAMPQDAIYASDVAGTVTIGGSWTLPLAVNQLSLANAKLPFNKSVAVEPAVTVELAGEIALTAEFRVRFRRAGANLLRVGLYKKKGQTFEASFTAGAGLDADVGTTDLIAKFFGAVDPRIHLDSLQPGDAAKIQQVLKDSIDRGLAISLNAACSAAHSDEVAFAYELDISAVDQATRDALDGALRGDWSGISKLDNARKLRNVVKETVAKTYSITVNLLGLYNYRSVEEFVRTMKVMRNDEDASIVITDSATAKHIVAASTPLAADPDRLRAALYVGFVATATYKALLTGAAVTAEFGATQDFLLYKESMGYRDALKQLNTGEALGVMQPDVKTGLRPAGPNVHHARFAASRTYAKDDVLRFFFSDIEKLTPRTEPDLEKTGRAVLARLLDPQDPTDQKRIAMLSNDAAWNELNTHPAQIEPPYYSDWYDITDWAGAIAKVGPILADTIRFARTVEGDPTKNAEFIKKRDALARALEGATHKAHAAFERAFPICVMATLAGLTPGAAAPLFEAVWDSNTIFTNRPVPQVAAARIG